MISKDLEDIQGRLMLNRMDTSFWMQENLYKTKFSTMPWSMKFSSPTITKNWFLFGDKKYKLK